jgi:FkbM family methyltransferase
MINVGQILARLLGQDRRFYPTPVFLGDRIFAVTHRGHVIYLPPSDLDLTPRILLNGNWEPHVEQTIARFLGPGDTAIDLGANVGYHTLAMAAAVGLAGKVHAFEANPDLTPLLTATMYANSYRDWEGGGCVRLYESAVLDRAGTVTLASAPGHYASGHVMIDSGPGYSQRIEVPAVTLDGVLSDRLEKVDLIRMDIEGSEPLALRGAQLLIERSPAVKVVTEWVVEFMRSRTDVDAFVAWLVERGFKFWVIGRGPKFARIEPSAAAAAPPCEMLLSRQQI